MRRLPRSTRTWLLAASLVVLFALAGAVVISVLPSGGPVPGAPPSVVGTRIAILTGTATPITATVAVTATPAITVAPPLTPTLVVSSTATLTPTIVSPPPSPATLVLEGLTIPARKAAFIRNKDVWVVESGRGEQALTTYGDVEAIFGWNKDATMLLFGRGRKQQGVHVGDTTELWLADLSAKTYKQLTMGSNVHTAAWSPADNRIAYCEHDGMLRIAGVDGKPVQQLSGATCFFSWSSDGINIAAVTFTPESIKETNVEIYDFLTIWQLAGGQTLQIKTERGLVYDPIWSMDSQAVIFQLARAGVPQSVWHVADVATGVVKQLEGTPKVVADFVSRSPRADIVAFRVEKTIYTMEFSGKVQAIDLGRSPIWLPGGNRVIYRGSDEKMRVAERDLASPALVEAGGTVMANGLYSSPDYFLAR